MHLQITEEQGALRDAVTSFLDKASSPEAVREAEPLGWDPKVWAGLTDMGVPTLGVSAELGGSGASLRDMAVVAEACGARLAPAPVVETMVAARLLARFPDAAGSFLTDLIEGGAPVAIAVRPATDGRATLVPGARGRHRGHRPRRRRAGRGRHAGRPGSSPANLGSAPLADVELTGDSRTVLASGDAARSPPTTRPSTSTGRSPPAGSSAWPARPSRSASSTPPTASSSACPSARSRPCSTASPTSQCDLDGADLLANKAVWALDVGDPVAASFPWMAFWFAGDTAQRAGVVGAPRPRRLRVHGGVRHPAVLPPGQGRPPAAGRPPPRAPRRWPTASGPTRPPERSPARPCG